MNYCRRCESDYERPGTCNCFAQTQPIVPAPIYVPIYPSEPTPRWLQPYPTYPLYPQITFSTSSHYASNTRSQ